MDHTGTVTDRRANCFDFLRLVAALSVVVGHAVSFSGESILWVDPASRFWFYDGVPAFFIISGYLVYQSALRCQERGRSMWDYGLNRFLRIAPALAVWAVAVAAVWVATGYRTPNGALWTIPAECSFYLVLPLVLWITNRWGWRPALVLMLATAAVGMVTGVLSDTTGLLEVQDYTFVPWAVFFLLGMLWLRYGDLIPLALPWAVLAAAAYLAFRTFDVFDLKPISDHALMYAGAVPLSYVVIYVAFRGPRILAVVPQVIGDLSYGTYIWHLFIVWSILRWGLDWPAWTVIPATLAVASASWWLVERPALRLKRYSSRWLPLPGGVVQVETAPDLAPSEGR